MIVTADLDKLKLFVVEGALDDAIEFIQKLRFDDSLDLLRKYFVTKDEIKDHLAAALKKLDGLGQVQYLIEEIKDTSNTFYMKHPDGYYQDLNREGLLLCIQGLEDELASLMLGTLLTNLEMALYDGFYGFAADCLSLICDEPGYEHFMSAFVHANRLSAEVLQGLREALIKHPYPPSHWNIPEEKQEPMDWFYQTEDGEVRLLTVEELTQTAQAIRAQLKADKHIE